MHGERKIGMASSAISAISWIWTTERESEETETERRELANPKKLKLRGEQHRAAMQSKEAGGERTRSRGRPHAAREAIIHLACTQWRSLTLALTGRHRGLGRTADATNGGGWGSPAPAGALLKDPRPPPLPGIH